MRIRRAVRSMSTAGSNFFGAVLKAVVTSLALVMFVVSIMHYMGVPVPSAHDLLKSMPFRVF
ncbi:MAG TPA: hypothetical protein VHH35_06730 [Pyrinomonadaceae bacterium]|nr:hypothetical protein [Pyrinomonadaceae bacterium]